MVKVVSAVKLTSEEVKALEAELGTRNLELSVNPTIIGGLRLTVNGKTIDLSIRTKLNQLRDSMA